MSPTGVTKANGTTGVGSSTGAAASPKQKLLELLKSDESRSRYLDKSSTMYVPKSGGIVCRYEDSKLSHTEGYVYSSYMPVTTSRDMTIADPGAKKNQDLFNDIAKGSESHFPNVPNTENTLAWLQGDDDSAADADVFRILNYHRASELVKSGVWSKGNISYEKIAKQASEEFLKYGCIKIDGSKNKLLIPTSGINTNRSYNSNFVKKNPSNPDELVFMYNPSYSYSLASNELKSLDSRWEEVKSSQNLINTKILGKLGVVDWCVVKVNSKTGDIHVSDELDKFFPRRSNSQQMAANIEWPRFIMDQGLNYLENKDQGSMDILKMVKAKYGTNLNGLKYSNYRNELVVALSTLMHVVFDDLDEASLNDFKNNVMGADKYYGNKYYDASKHTFQQLLVGMINEGMESYLSDNKNLSTLNVGSSSVVHPNAQIKIEQVSPKSVGAIKLPSAGWWKPWGNLTMTATEKSITMEGQSNNWYVGGTGIEMNKDLSGHSNIEFQVLEGRGKVKFEIEASGTKYSIERMCSQGQKVKISLSDFGMPQNATKGTYKLILGLTGTTSDGLSMVKFSLPEITK